MAAAPQDRPRRSDVDFADVFGGPPRRSSGHDHLRRGRSRAESLDASYALSRGWSTGSAPGERAVFGERTSSDRRRQLGEEFYSDIFPGSECPSPRRSGGDRNVFGRPASPGSTIRPRLSCSFSMKWGRGMDNSMPTSPSHHAASRNDDGTSYAYSLPSSPNSSINSFFARAAPSRFRSQNGDKKDASHYVNSMESEHQGTPASLESYINKNKFHFSFYKWAGKGALLVMPAPSQEKGEKVIGLRGFPQVVVQGIDLIDNEDNMSTTTGASKSQTDYEDCKSGKDSFMERKDSTNSTSKEGAVPSLFDNYMQSDKAEEPGTKSSADDAKINVLAASPSSRNSKSPSGDRSRGSRVKGKVKDFIKIFTPEGSPKRKGTFESQDQRSSGKNGRRDGVQDKISISSSEANEDVKTTQMNKETAFWAATSPMKEVQEKMEEPVLKVDSEMQASTGISSESIHDASKDKEGNREGGEGSHIEDLEGCVVEHLSEDQYDSLQNDHEKEQIKISESKIREWSKGKEGNIRSLLSTLQYVLWPESGWQPVPLVNIIEGAAVKKAYQKALLCLHPDKLQQRGAAMHQKYIAEKVFDILQEAWTEFNSVSFG